MSLHLCDTNSRLSFFFFNDTATTEIYTLSLHDALPISCYACLDTLAESVRPTREALTKSCTGCSARSEEHTSELQSQSNLVCRLLLEKKKKYTNHALISPPQRRSPPTTNSSSQ